VIRNELKNTKLIIYHSLKGGEKKSINGFIPMTGCQGREVKILRCPAAVKGTKTHKDSESEQ
jgi:hypothetical protein